MRKTRLGHVRAAPDTAQALNETKLVLLAHAQFCVAVVGARNIATHNWSEEKALTTMPIKLDAAHGILLGTNQ
jgi:hypothetical protein